MAQEAGRPRVIPLHLPPRLLDRRRQRRNVSDPDVREFKQYVRSLRSRRDLPEQLFQHRLRPRRVTREAQQVRRPAPAPSAKRGIVRRQLRRQLREFRGASRRSPGRSVLGRRIQLPGDTRIRPLRCQRQMPGPLFEIAHHPGERAVNRSPLPDRRARIADRRQQRMRETNPGIGQLNNLLDGRHRNRLTHPFEVPVRRRHQLDRRPRQRRDLEKHIGGLGRQLRQTPAEQVDQTLRHPQALSR